MDKGQKFPEEEDETKKDLDFEEEITKKKCSLEEHEEIDAIIYCKECNIYMCNKCNNHHSQLFKNHKQYNLDKDTIKLFLNICKKSNHNMKLQYFCEDHNVLCCAACISKIRTNGNGIHNNCSVYPIEKIINKKKSMLPENTKHLENISKTMDKTINELKALFEKLNKRKEQLKEDIKNIFTKIKSAVNEREEEILVQVDKKYEESFFKDDLIKQSEKLPNKIKISLENGKIDDSLWEEKDKLNSLIYYSICIENNIKEFKSINDKMNNYIDLKIIFKPEEDEINNFIQTIKKFGKLDIINIKKENIYIDNKKIDDLIELYDNEYNILTILEEEEEFRQKIIELNYDEDRIRDWIEEKLS